MAKYLYKFDFDCGRMEKYQWNFCGRRQEDGFYKPLYSTINKSYFSYWTDVD